MTCRGSDSGFIHGQSGYIPVGMNSTCKGIHNIPCYFEGETLYSYFFRVADCNGLTHIRQLFDMIDDNSEITDTWKRYYWAGYDFVYPRILDGFSCSDNRNLILESSLLRFFSLFCSADYIARKVRAYTYPNTFNENIFDDVPNLYGKPRVCKMCISEDLENLGFFYIRNVHQLPGITVCLKHKHLLSVYKGEYGRELDADSYSDVDYEVSMKYAEFVVALYSSNVEGCLYTTVLTVVNRVLSVTGENDLRYALEILFSRDDYSIIHESFACIRGLLFNNSSNSCEIEDFIFFIAVLYDWEASQFVLDLEHNRINYKRDFEDSIANGYRLVSSYSSICNTVESLLDGSRWTISVASMLEGWPTPSDAAFMNQKEVFEILFERNCQGYVYLEDFKAWNYRIPVKNISTGEVYKIRADRLISITPKTSKVKAEPIETRIRMCVEADARFSLVSFCNSGAKLLLRIRCMSCGGIFDVYAKDFYASSYCRLCGKDRCLTEARAAEIVRSISFSRYKWCGSLADGIFKADGNDVLEASTFENLKEKIRVRVRAISGNKSISDLCKAISARVRSNPDDVYFNEDFIQLGYKQDIRNAISRLVGRSTVVHHGIGVFTSPDKEVTKAELLDAKYFLRHGKRIGIPIGDTLLRYIGISLEDENYAYALYQGNRTTLHIDRRKLDGLAVSIVFTDIKIDDENWKILALLLTLDNLGLITKWDENYRMALYVWSVQNKVSIASVVQYQDHFTRKTIDYAIAFLKGPDNEN